MGIIKKTSHTIVIATLIAILFVLVSCGKKPIESTHTIERIIEHRKDSIVNREISKAIQDSLFLKINEIKSAKPECDSIINAEIKKLLHQIATKKKSGDNELGFLYDELKNQIVLYGKLSESAKESVLKTKDLIDTLKDSKVIEVPVKYIPKWVQCLAIFGFVCLLFIAGRIFYKIQSNIQK